MILKTRRQKLMGNQFELMAYHSHEGICDQSISAGINEIIRIERLLTTYHPDSITSKINQNAGVKPVEVPEEVLGLIDRSLKISRLTQGAFDLSYGGIDKRLWNFDTTMTSLPTDEEIKRSIAYVNYQNILIDYENHTVMLAQKGMRIGFGGIGKGYAADRAQRIMKSMGIESGVVNASGDIATWGKKPDGTPWQVGIVDPNLKHTFFASLPLIDQAIATSGTYEKYVIINGVKYSHTINPKTGYPIQGTKSVTTICPYAEFADAMTTPIAILGVEKGLALVNQINGLEAIIIDDSDQIHTSNHIKIAN